MMIRRWWKGPLHQDAVTAVETSRRNLEQANENYLEVQAIKERLRIVKERNNLAAAIEFQLRGARS